MRVHRAFKDPSWYDSRRRVLATYVVWVALMIVVTVLPFRNDGAVGILLAVELPATFIAIQWWRGRREAAPAPGERAASGWYPDPTGRHEERYWQGDRWAANVVDGGVESIDAKIAVRRARDRGGLRETAAFRGPAPE